MAITYHAAWAASVLATEALRLEHNATGTQFTGGLLTEKAWRDYKQFDWRPRMELAQDEEDDAYHALRMAVINGR